MFQPHFIAGLLKSAAVRHLEEERRLQRKAQLELEQSGESADAPPEQFVTENYRKRLAAIRDIERAQAEQEDRGIHWSISLLYS